MKQETMHKSIFLTMMAVVLMSNVYAFAVSSAYYGNNPLYLQPGESKEVFFTLQNLASPENVRLQAIITEGEEYTEVTDSSNVYDVPAGEKTKVNFIVTAPADAKKGDVFPISMEFTAMSVSGEGPIGLSGSIGKGFNVAIGDASDFEKKAFLTENFSGIIYATIGILLIAAIIFYLRKRQILSRRDSKSR